MKKPLRLRGITILNGIVLFGNALIMLILLMNFKNGPLAWMRNGALKSMFHRSASSIPYEIIAEQAGGFFIPVLFTFLTLLFIKQRRKKGLIVLTIICLVIMLGNYLLVPLYTVQLFILIFSKDVKRYLQKREQEPSIYEGE